MNIHDLYPELECIERGDPYLEEICKADDVIDDYTYNAELLGVVANDAALTVRWAERTRLTYELSLLYKWWGLNG
jgi:hypothetical protein